MIAHAYDQNSHVGVGKLNLTLSSHEHLKAVVVSDEYPKDDAARPNGAEQLVRVANGPLAVKRHG